MKRKQKKAKYLARLKAFSRSVDQFFIKAGTNRMWPSQIHPDKHIFFRTATLFDGGNSFLSTHTHKPMAATLILQANCCYSNPSWQYFWN